MAVPKRRTSGSRTCSHRARWKATPVQRVRVRIGGLERLVLARLRKAAERGLLR